MKVIMEIELIINGLAEYSAIAMPAKVISALLVAPVSISCFVTKLFEALIELFLLIDIISDTTHIERPCHYSH